MYLVLQFGNISLQLQQTQKELSRIQQLNKNLQEELRQEKERHLGKLLFTQVKLFFNYYHISCPEIVKISMTFPNILISISLNIQIKSSNKQEPN